MDAALIPAPTQAPAIPAIPGWALPRGPVADPLEAAFLAGAALNSLDTLVRSEPGWAGAWRARLALACAVGAARAAGRPEGEAGLRDAWFLRPPDADPGPAGRLLAAWRRLGARASAIDGDALASVCDRLGIAWSAPLADLPDGVARELAVRRPAPLAAAAVVRLVEAADPGAGLLGWWLADHVLARALRWPLPVPLLMAELHGAAFRRPGGGGRVRPGEAAFDAAICVALARAAAGALRCAAEIAPRAARLQQVAPKLRAKGAGDAIALLLDDDAVPGTRTTATLSRWGARRLFERLETLGAVRELTGRSAFRLYGL
ncbi:DUF1403 family protein [Ancylobacter terrae]|uniref:DUF1403 family protein n=1 Tax=Ancylobacter sp. sgz301288 TaxID=3342077 RepID=UPI00385CAC13